MEHSIKKFLEFNGRKIYLKSVDSNYWIAIKPICEALQVDYSRQLRTLKSDNILGRVWSLQTMHDTSERLQEMACLPEFYIYGWLFQIQSESEVLQEYKWKCYEILHNHFHGSITERITHLKEKTKAEKELEEVEKQLRESDLYKQKESLIAKIRAENKAAQKLDKEFISSQLGLWDINSVPLEQ